MPSSLIRHERYFTSLPGRYYTSREIFEQEVERVFARTWFYVGQVGMLRAPGDFVATTVAGEGIILVRDDEGGVRAFFNVCRHRGSQLCAAGETGQARQLVCPYHRWSWRLDGSLLGAPGMRDGREFDFADFPLHAAHCAVHHGAIFVCIGEQEPPALTSTFPVAPDAEALTRVDPSRQRLAHEARYRVAANWKLLLENNTECYHCSATHPSLGIACDYTAFFTPEEGQLESERVASSSYFPLREGMSTFSMTGDWVCRRPLGDGLPAGFSTGYMALPMFGAVLYFADHGVNLQINPVDVATTELVAQWFVHEDAVENADYAKDDLIAVFDVTNREDLALAEGNQRGVRSRRFVPGPNCPTREPFVEEALTAYLRLMDA